MAVQGRKCTNHLCLPAAILVGLQVIRSASSPRVPHHDGAEMKKVAGRLYEICARFGGFFFFRSRRHAIVGYLEPVIPR